MECVVVYSLLQLFTVISRMSFLLSSPPHPLSSPSPPPLPPSHSPSSPSLPLFLLLPLLSPPSSPSSYLFFLSLPPPTPTLDDCQGQGLFWSLPSCCQECGLPKFWGTCELTLDQKIEICIPLVYLQYISSVPPVYLQYTSSVPPVHTICIPPVYHLYILLCTCISPIYLQYTTCTPPVYLQYISSIPPGCLFSLKIVVPYSGHSSIAHEVLILAEMYPAQRVILLCLPFSREMW